MLLITAVLSSRRSMECGINGAFTGPELYTIHDIRLDLEGRTREDESFVCS